MASETKKDVEVKVPEHPKKKESDFQSVYDNIIRGVTKAGKKE